MSVASYFRRTPAEPTAQHTVLPHTTTNEVPLFTPPTVGCHNGSCFVLFLPAARDNKPQWAGRSNCRGQDVQMSSHLKDFEVKDLQGLRSDCMMNEWLARLALYFLGADREGF